MFYLIARVARQAPSVLVELVPTLLEGHAARGVAVASDRKRLAHLGVFQDLNLKQQRYEATAVKLITAAIVLWDTVYLERAINALRDGI